MEVKSQVTNVPFDDIFKTLTTVSDDSLKNDFFDNPKEFDSSVITNKEEEIKEDEIEEVKVDDIEDNKSINDNKVVDDIVKNTNQKTDNSEEGDFGDINKFYNELIKDELLVGFSDDKPVTSFAEIKELIEENKKMIRQNVINEELPSFVESFSPELQALIKYESEGGTDRKGMFKALAEVEEFRQFEVIEKDIKAQEEVAMKYLKATNYAKGNEDEIKELIEEWKDNDSLFKRSKKFKVELDEMHEELVAQKLQEQEQKSLLNQKREQEKKELVYTSIIKDNDLNGIKLDKDIQNKLFSGLTQKVWESEDGRKVDMLDAIIEFYKYKQPNFKLLGEALYLLLEPEKYKGKVSIENNAKRDGQTLRTLKTEQGRRASSTADEQNKQGIKRGNNNNFWK